MLKKIFYLSTCSTCQRIMKELGVDDSFELKDIKRDKITVEELESIADYAGSYADIFSRRAMKYRAMGLHERTLSESDMKNLILEEYTFIKRPIVQIDDDYFIGNSKKMVEAAKVRLYG